LEAGKERVKGLFEKIRKDRRYKYDMLLNEDEKEERIFPNWRMAYYDLNNENLKEAERLLFIRNFIVVADLSEKPTHAVRLFWHNAKEPVGPWSLGDA
jgi:hypothetical protein